MAKLRRSGTLVLGLAAVLGLAGCATVSAPPPRVFLEEPAAELADIEARRAAWIDARDIVRLLAKVDAANGPGIAAWVADFQAAEQRGFARRVGLTAAELETLVVRNAHFWQASLEIAPSDPLVTLLYATLLASADETGRAADVLRVMRLSLTMPDALERVYQKHARLFNWADRTPSPADEADWAARPLDERVDDVSSLLRVAPHSPALLRLGVELQLEAWGLAEALRAETETAPALAEALRSLAEPLAELRRRAPTTAWIFSIDPARRLQGRRLEARFAELVEPGNSLGARDLRALADACADAGRDDLALLALRLQEAARGFPVRSDANGAEKILRSLAGEDGAALAARWQRGEIRQLAFFPPTWENPGPGASLVHPLLVHRYRREIVDATELIQGAPAQGGDSLTGYVRRAWRLLYLGEFEKAQADIDRLSAITGPTPVVADLQAAWLLAQDRVAEAATTLDAAASRRLPTDRPLDRLHVDYASGRVAEAVNAQLARHADPRLDGESRFYAALHAVAMGRRLHGALTTDERALLAASRTLIAADAWAQHLRAFLLGEETEAQLMARAWIGSDYGVAAQLCEAYYFLGMVALAAGETERALNHFEACMRTGVVDFIEYGLARQELRRLAPERVPKPLPTEEPPRAPGERSPRSFEDAEPSWVVPT